MYTGINPDNQHQNIHRILFENTHTHNRCRIIGGSERPWAERLHIRNHLVLGVYNLLHPQSTTLIQTFTHACCCFVVSDKHRPSSPNKVPWVPPSSLYCHAPFHTFYSLANWIIAVFALTPFFIFSQFLRKHKYDLCK